MTLFVAFISFMMGGAMGVMLMALMVAARDDDDEI